MTDAIRGRGPAQVNGADGPGPLALTHILAHAQRAGPFRPVANPPHSVGPCRGFRGILIPVTIHQQLGGTPDTDIINAAQYELLNYGGGAMLGSGRNIDIWVAFGIGAGVIIGAVAGNIVGWIIGGAVVGALVGTGILKRRS